MQSHRYKIGGNYLVLLFLLIILILSSFGFFYFGEVRINVLKVLLNNEINEKELFILYKIRLPRLILAISVGGILSICGAVLQGIFRNPMVEPFTLGISGGAALGISIAISTGIVSYTGSIGLPIFGFIGSVFTIFLVYYLTVYDGIFSINRMLLIGIMISFISSSLITLIMSLSTKDDLFRIIYWTMGSLDESNALLIKSVFFSSIIGFILIYIFSNSLNAIQLDKKRLNF